MTKKETIELNNKDSKNNLFCDLNKAITEAAENAGITKDQAYTFMIEFGEVIIGNKNGTITDVDNILKELKEVYKAYEVELNNLDTKTEESIGRHKFLSGKLKGIDEAINIIANYEKVE